MRRNWNSFNSMNQRNGFGRKGFSIRGIAIAIIIVAALGIIGTIAGGVIFGKDMYEVALSSDEVGNSNPNAQAILNNATEIRIEEKYFSLNKHYNIFVDGEKVAQVTGKVFNSFGDEFVLKDVNGAFLLKEREVKRWGRYTRTAVLEDEQNQVVGYIAERLNTKLFNTGYYFHFFDAEQNEIGVSDQVFFSAWKKNKFYGANDTLAYTVKQVPSMATNKFTLTVHDKTDISLYQAILMVCIESAIADAESDDD